MRTLAAQYAEYTKQTQAVVVDTEAALRSVPQDTERAKSMRRAAFIRELFKQLGEELAHGLPVDFSGETRIIWSRGGIVSCRQYDKPRSVEINDLMQRR